MESMRAVGYSLTTALADVIDNSITAKSTRIDISFSGHGNPYLAILDNGTGMDARAARTAMQLAGTSSTAARDGADLGRFGLGLKTASLSQCRCLTVVTKANDMLTALRWDLDYIAKTGEWRLQVLDASELDEIPGIASLRALRTGTLVVWQDLDKALEGVADPARRLDEQMAEAREHLSLVFHRFLAGEVPLTKVAMAINMVEIVGSDPFLSKSFRTQRSDEEFIDVDGQQIAVKAYTLPFLNKMSAAERKLAQVAGTLRDSQGFYVYRAGRLVIWGTWFRLMPKTDSGKLTRVRVDIPNTLDHLWSLDIKKSSAVPPSLVRERLRMLAGTLVQPSEKAHSFRGIKVEDTSLLRAWNVVVDRDTFRYVINRDHPLLRNVTGSLDGSELDSLEAALRIVESSFPAQDLANRMSSDHVVDQTADAETLRSVLLGLWQQRVTASDDADVQTFLAMILNIEPFNELRSDGDLHLWLEQNTEK